MKDLFRVAIGLLGVLGGFTLAHAATIAAILASAATTVFMGLSALEKWDARKARRAQTPPTS